ncbi:hypothetical protein FHT08_001448 [Xanthomonas campestris]|nr:hypothetical protein [Xanthomonas sp. CFBP 8151]
MPVELRNVRDADIPAITVGVFTGIGRKHGRWLDGVQMQRARLR